MKEKTLARISPTKAKSFLTELANLTDDEVARFQKRFGDLIPRVGIALFATTLADKHSIRELTEEDKKQSEEHWILELRNLVRRVWIEPDLRTKRYGVFLLWKWAMFSKGWVEQGIPYSLPPPNPFEQAIQLLIDAADLAHYCGNPECFTPYFFASRRNQKYCSDACAKPAQREFKRQWWAEHGEEWRATRKKAHPVVKSKRPKARI
jgi:hypothetical protein